METSLPLLRKKTAGLPGLCVALQRKQRAWQGRLRTRLYLSGSPWDPFHIDHTDSEGGWSDPREQPWHDQETARAAAPLLYVYSSCSLKTILHGVQRSVLNVLLLLLVCAGVCDGWWYVSYTIIIPGWYKIIPEMMARISHTAHIPAQNKQGSLHERVATQKL